MDKLYIWFNPRTHSIYSKIAWCTPYNVGEYNSYGHLLLEILEFYDNKVQTFKSLSEKYRQATQKRNKRNKRLLNKLFSNN